MRDHYGQYADRFYLVDAKEDRRKDILTEFFKDKDGVLLTEQLKEEWTNELKELGLKSKEGKGRFTFITIKKYCEEFNICSFIEVKANKKDCELNNEIQYRKKYLKVKLVKE